MTGDNDSGYPEALLTLGADRKVFGTTEFGGADGYGTATNGAFAALRSFTYQENGLQSPAALVQLLLLEPG